jgi:hypothetical protein
MIIIVQYLPRKKFCIIRRQPDGDTVLLHPACRRRAMESAYRIAHRQTPPAPVEIEDKREDRRNG